MDELSIYGATKNHKFYCEYVEKKTVYIGFLVVTMKEVRINCKTRTERVKASVSGGHKQLVSQRVLHACE